MSKKILVTHSGSFHADDIFACATLAIYLEQEGETWEVVRTRDEEKIAKGDFVFDVGGVYDPEKNRFDHHQKGGAGKRENGIEYASFGLVWRKYGAVVSEDTAVAELIDKKLVQPIDAGDNGMEIVKSLGVAKPYLIQNVFTAHRPSWKELNEETLVRGFLESVALAKNILIYEMKHEREATEAKILVEKFYQEAEDKRVVVLDKRYPWQESLVNHPEPLFVIFPRLEGNWGIDAVPRELFSFELRKRFPEAWAGLSNDKLSEVSGVPGAIFCHRGLFMAVAKTEGDAIKLAKKALQD